MATRHAAPRSTRTATSQRAVATRRKLRAHALAQVADYLRASGFDDPDALKTRAGYQFDFHELTIFAGVRAEGRDLVYLVGTEVMTLPSDADLVVPLMRELLEMNARARGPVRFAIDGDSIWVVAVDVVDLLPDADYGRSIDAVIAWADQARRLLRKKYHRTTRKRR